MTAPAYALEPDDQPDPAFTIATLGLSMCPPADHEPAAVLRMQRRGWPGPKIAEHFGIPPTTLVDQMNAALAAEGDAKWSRRPTIDDKGIQ